MFFTRDDGEPMRKSITVLGAAVFVALLGASQCLAQSDAEEIVRSGDGLSVLALNHRVMLPLPVWMESGADAADVSGEVEVFRQGVPGGELVEVIAVGQSFDKWEHMISAFVMDRAAMPPEMHKRLIASAFVQNCAKDRLFLQEIGPVAQGGRSVALLVCEAYNTALPQTGLGLGEIMAIVIVESPSASARVYAEWRGPAFDANDVSTWPVADINLFNQTLKRLSSVSAMVPVGD